MIIRSILTIICVGFILYSPLTHANATDAALKAAKEEKIQQLMGLPLEDAFQSLKRAEFFYDDELLKKGIQQAFGSRKKEATRLAMRSIRTVQKAGDANQAKEFHVAKKILQGFPGESQQYVKEFNTSGDPRIRRNIVMVVSGMPDGELKKSILKKALKDQSVCEEKLADSAGEPLRVCDITYNQIVHQNKVQNMLRTIGTVHNVEVRDYHIAKLRTML
jgi:hypothetical protein